MTKNLLLTGFLFLAGCAGHSSSSSSDTSATEAAAITIHDLSLSPTTVPVGKATAMTGELTFEAPGGNVSEMVADLTLPSGAVQPVPRSQVPNAKGVTGGPLEIAFFIEPGFPGSYVLTIHLGAADGTLSNPLTTTITAE